MTSASPSRFSRLTSMPMETSRSHIVSTSAMWGTFRSTCSPSARMVAAISLRAEFLAPPTATLPSSGGPGRTTNRSTTPVWSTGCGTADMKGGIAAAICALGVLKRAGRAPACNLVFHLVADEERGGALGTAVLVERGLVRGNACLVPEPTGLQICVAERGMLVVEV